jgi:hypothetical protein
MALTDRHESEIRSRIEGTLARDSVRALMK